MVSAGAASARAGSPAPVKEEDVAGKAAAEAQQSTEPAAVTDNTSPTTSMLSKEQPAAADTDQLATDSQDVHVVASQDGAPGSPTQVETAAEVIDEGKPLVLAAEPAEASVEAAIQADAVAVTALPESPAVSLEAAEGIEVEDADVSQGMSQEPKKQASDTVEQDDIALAVEGDASGSPEPMEIAATVAATADEVQPSTDHQEPAVNAAANKVITAVTGSDTAAAPTDMEVDTEGAIAPADEPQAKPADAPASPVAVIKPEPISGDEPAGDESVPTAAPAADESGKSDPKDAKASDAEAHSHSPAGPDKQDVGKASGTESSARGIKRSAPAVPVARGAKLARTSQAAGNP